VGCRRRGSKLRIEVWDTGFGIPKEQINRIFEEYYQLNNPARDRGKGLGLGLAIVERSSRHSYWRCFSGANAGGARQWSSGAPQAADPEALLAMIYQLLAGDERPEPIIVN